MSDSEVPRQSGSEEGFPDAPAAPRWDDPPGVFSNEELTRLIPGERDDLMLGAVSEALREPDPRYATEPAAVRAERLRRITAQGDRLRARWAETAALEEAYSAPASTMTRRQLVARSSRRAVLQQRLAQQRLERRRHIAVLLAGACGASMLLTGAIVALFLYGSVTLTSATATVGVTVVNTAVMIVTNLRLTKARSEARKTARLLRHFSRSRVPHGPAQTKETPMTTSD
ncbi:hypothetical protein [Streptomyces sp. NPDC086766]|uniref:hypothetical protein n=1 Tax=Streptomyces sp. NPDC086766 TaxID=3365754 RepID=UPI0038060386